MIEYFEEKIFSVFFEADNQTGYQVMLYLLGVTGRNFEQLQDEIARKRIEVMSRW